MRPTTQLRQLIARPGALMAPGVADALNARLVRRHGIRIHAGQRLRDAVCVGQARHAIFHILQTHHHRVKDLGAGEWQTFRYVFLPMSVPILAVVFVLSFIGHITEYPVASVLLRQTDNMTLAVGARQAPHPPLPERPG